MGDQMAAAVAHDDDACGWDNNDAHEHESDPSPNPTPPAMNKNAITII